MPSRKTDEEIIELTDVLEEGSELKDRPLPPTVRTEQRGSSGAPRDFQSIPDSPLKKFILAEQEEAFPSSPRESLPGPLPPPEASPSARIPPPGNKSQPLEQSLAVQVEKWMSDQGRQMIERMVREMFPGIAAEVLRKEIQKLKAETEEKP